MSGLVSEVLPDVPLLQLRPLLTPSTFRSPSHPTGSLPHWKSIASVMLGPRPCSPHLSVCFSFSHPHVITSLVNRVVFCRSSSPSPAHSAHLTTTPWCCSDRERFQRLNSHLLLSPIWSVDRWFPLCSGIAKKVLNMGSNPGPCPIPIPKMGNLGSCMPQGPCKCYLPSGILILFSFASLPIHNP